MNVTPRSDNKIEYTRIKKLSEFDLDYFNLQEEFEALVRLAASIAGTEFSMVNLIDNYFQWTVATHELELPPMPREDSVCNLTIKRTIPVEILRLDRDERFYNKSYVNGQDGLKYYLGIPLTLSSGENIGALCVLDKEEKKVSEDKVEQLKIIAAEVVNKLEMIKKINDLETAVAEAEKDTKRLAHDVRSPLSGIAHLCEVLEGEEISPSEFVSYLDIISKAGKGILELTEDILSKGIKHELFYNLEELGQRLIDLYKLPANTKNLDFRVICEVNEKTRFPGMKLLSAIGNLISNAIKFTPSGGWVNVRLAITGTNLEKKLIITVTDNGVGITNTFQLLEDDTMPVEAKIGTNGEEGFGLGLQLVREVVENRNGQLFIDHGKEQGTEVKLEIPIF